MAKIKWFLCVPSKEQVAEWKGEIHDIRPFKETTARGKELEGIIGRIINNVTYNIFFKSAADCKSFITLMKARQKKVDAGKAVDILGYSKACKGVVFTEV